MYTRARVLGQAVNPVLMLLPLAILVIAALADLAALLSGWHFFATIAHADMVPGLVLGVVALCALLVDLLTAATGSEQRAVLSVVCTAFGAMLALFTIVWTVQADAESAMGGLFFFELLGLACGIVATSLARGLAVGRPLPKRLLGAEPRRADARVSSSRIARAMGGRWIPAAGSDDPEATVAIFGLATGRAPVRRS